MAQIEGLIERLYRERYVGFRNALAPVVGSREAAHDVVQEAFANALAEAGKLRRAESLAPWVWQIALRIALRQGRRGTEVELPDDLSILDEERDPALAAAVRRCRRSGASFCSCATTPISPTARSPRRSGSRKVRSPPPCRRRTRRCSTS
jgi:DNA-directed RNA polymerase specialized sigma24 family protein